MIAKFSFLKLLNDILKESEIQEEAKADKVIGVYVLDFISFFPPEESNCYIDIQWREQASQVKYRSLSFSNSL